MCSIDARHGLKDVDDERARDLDKAAVNYQIVLDQSRQVKPAERAPLHRGDRGGARPQRPAAYPQCLRHLGAHRRRHAELRAAIARLVAERDELRRHSGTH